MLQPKSFTPSDVSALKEFYQKAYPTWINSSEYLDKTLFSLPSSVWQDSLLIYDNESIVGVNLCIPAKALIGQNEHNIVWSYDTLVLSEYRSTDAGTFIAEFWYKRKNLFGAGLSDISERMCHIMKSKFLAFVPAFLKFNFKSKFVFNFIYPCFSTKAFIKKDFPKLIRTKGGLFERINHAEELQLPESGYWNEDLIEFKRDQNFIKWRFFYKDSPYVLYTLKHKEAELPVYFAARICVWHNMPLIYIVDYRFPLTVSDSFNLILKSAEYLCYKLGCAGVYIRSSLDMLNKILKNKGYLRKGRGAQIVSRFKPATEKDYPVFFTAVDSDMDFKISENLRKSANK